MPTVGDELHHFGWNTCSSCHSDSTPKTRAATSSSPASNPQYSHHRRHRSRQPPLVKTIDGARQSPGVNLSTPHTVHCLPDGHMLISMLGDAQGNAPGGFLLLNSASSTSSAAGRTTSTE